MSWLSPRAVRRRRAATRTRRPFTKSLALTELETRVNPANVLQYHMDSQSTGVNNSETILTRSNVNSTTFGKLWQVQVQGQVYAEPLVETGVNITTGPNQGMHDVVFVATQHDQLYAYDANAAAPTLLWQRSFLSDANNTNPGDLLSGATSVTTVPQAAIISSDVTVEIGITGTPVIDPATGTLYVVAKTAETVSGTVHYVQRLYAVNVQNGSDKTAPFLLGDTTGTSTYSNYAAEPRNSSTAGSQIWVYGNGNGTNDHIVDPYFGTGLNIVSFNALREAQRPGLDLVNGVVYIAWASHGDNGPYHGWMVGVSATNATGTTPLALKGVLNTTPNGGLGGIWQAGGEVTFDGTYFYFETGNGTFDGGNGSGTGSNPTAPAPGPMTGIDNAGFPINGDYGDSFVKVALDPTTTASNQNRTTGVATQTAHSDGWGLKVVDFFTPFNQNYLNSTDKDVGSSAAVVVPDYNPGGGANQFASAAKPKLLIGSGKEGVIYMMDRSGSVSGVNPDVPGYTGSMGGYGKANYIVQNSANELSGSLDSAALFNGQMYYVEGYGGVGKSFTFTNGSFAAPATTKSTDAFAFAGSTPMITANNGANGIVWDVDRGTNQLRAYSTDSYATELYTSAQAPNGRDSLGAAVKFQVVTPANGRVFVASGTGDPNNFLVVYGLLGTVTGVPNAPSGLIAEPPPSGSLIHVTWTDNSQVPNTADSFYLERSTDGVNFTPLATVNSLTYVDTTITAGTKYYYRVKAHDSQGFSQYSNISAATAPTSSAHTINYSAGFTTANTTVTSSQGGLQFNNFSTAAIVTSPGPYLQLTSGTGGQSRSAYFTFPNDPTGHAGEQFVGQFTTSYTYLLTTATGPADGMTFVIQGAGLNALGAGGGSLGYAGTQGAGFIAVTPSLALGLNVYSGNARGTEILTNGVVDENFTQTNINTQQANAPITIRITYAAGFLYVTEQQTLNSVLQTDTKTYAVNLPALLGSDYAWVGFTAATGGASSTQYIQNWTFDQGVVPVAPTGVQATVTGYNGTNLNPPPLGAHLTWNAVTDTPAAGGPVSYKVLRTINPSGNYTQVGTSTTASFDDTSLATGTTYYYKVVATDTYGDSLPSAAVTITTPTLPPTPTNSQLNAVTSTSIAFQWQDNANNENGYLILRQVGSGGFSILAQLPPDTNPAPSTMTFTDTGLTPGTHYDYHIESYNLAGYSDFAGVSATTLSNAPSNLAANAANGQIQLTWTGVSGATSYNIYRGTTPGGEGATPYATGVAGTSFNDTSPAYNTTYYYKVSAIVGGTETNQSTEASAFFAAPPTVAGVQVNDGTNQRSEVRSITVTFSGPVSFSNGAAAAFQLTHLQNAVAVGLTAAVSLDAQNRTVVVLTFFGSETDVISASNGFAANPSLADGRYQLTIFGNKVQGTNGLGLDGAGTGTAGSNYVSPADTFGGAGLHLYRLYGDASGDGVVDATDLGQFRSTFNANNSQANYLLFLDADNSGAVDAQDLGQFRSRFNSNVF